MTGQLEILTAREVAMEMRCSIAHVYNVINGRVKNVSKLPSIQMGRRKLVQRASLEEWKRRNEQGSNGGMIELPETGAFRRRMEQMNA